MYTDGIFGTQILPHGLLEMGCAQMKRIGCQYLLVAIEPEKYKWSLKEKEKYPEGKKVLSGIITSKGYFVNNLGS